MQRLFVGLPAVASTTNYNDWGPRLGIAYDVFGNGKTAIRTGFGMFYDRVGSNQISAQAQNPPFVKIANIFDGNIDNPAGGTARSFPIDLNAWPEKLPTPSVISYNFGVQQQLPRSVILEVNYVGNVGRHLTYFRNLNQLPLGTRLNPPNSTINVNALRPYPGWGNISLRDDSDNSNYNSLQVSARRRMSARTVVWRRITRSPRRWIRSGAARRRTATIRSSMSGLSGIHRAHLLNFNYIYTLPFFAQQRETCLRA